MKKLVIIIIYCFSLSLNLIAQTTDNTFQHELSIHIDTIKEVLINNFDKDKTHWINFSFQNLSTDIEFKVERSYQIFRKGIKIHEQILTNQVFLKSNSMSLQIHNCFLLPGDSITVTLTYNLFSPWTEKWSGLFISRKTFQINSIANYEYSDYFIEILAFNNKTLSKPDKISIASYLKGKEYNPFITVKDNKYFYQNMGDSLKVTITFGSIHFKETYHRAPKYGGKILCGIVDQKKLHKEIKEFNKKNQYDWYNPINEPYFLLEADEFSESTGYIIMHDKCADVLFQFHTEIQYYTK